MCSNLQTCKSTLYNTVKAKQYKVGDTVQVATISNKNVWKSRIMKYRFLHHLVGPEIGYISSNDTLATKQNDIPCLQLVNVASVLLSILHILLQ